jgi:hypothetical protein
MEVKQMPHLQPRNHNPVPQIMQKKKKKKKNPQQQQQISSFIYQIISCSQTGGVGGEGRELRIAKKLHFTLKSKRRDHSRSDVEEESQTNSARRYYTPCRNLQN